MLPAFTRTVQLAESAPERLDFALVGPRLPFKHLQGLEHLFHLVQGFPKCFDDRVDLVYGSLQGRRSLVGRFRFGWRGATGNNGFGDVVRSRFLTVLRFGRRGIEIVRLLFGSRLSVCAFISGEGLAFGERQLALRERYRLFGRGHLLPLFLVRRLRLMFPILWRGRRGGCRSATAMTSATAPTSIGAACATLAGKGWADPTFCSGFRVTIRLFFRRHFPPNCLEWSQKQWEFDWTDALIFSKIQGKMSRTDPLRRASQWLVFCVLLSAICAPAQPKPAPKMAGIRKPNIILIVADDLGYGDLGSYGQLRIKTPNLDRLAAEGMRFTDFYAGSTVCAPSRCALMTGLHTGHALIRGNAKVALRPEDLTVAKLLKRADYHTGLVGKWGLGNEDTSGVPQKQGFDEFVGYLDQTHAHDYYTSYLWRYDPRTKFEGQVPFPENQGAEKKLYTHDLFTRAALNFVRINKPAIANQSRPFFLYLAYTIPHANNEEGKRSGNGMQVPSDAPYSDEPWPQTEKNKAAMITRLDTDIGRLLDKLQELNLDQDTLVLFTSDNGPHKEGGVDPNFFASSGRFRGIKRDLYEGGIRVPLLARWPGKIKSNRVSNEPFAFWDVLPTVGELAGEKPPKNIDGISFAPTLLGKAQTNHHDFFYWEFHEGGFKQAVRMANWKAVRLGVDKPLELYDLAADPGEKTDVAEQNPNVIKKIEDYLKSARTDSEQWPIKAAARKKE